MDTALCTILFFFFNDTATTEIYTLSLHDALPICTIRAPGMDRTLPVTQRRERAVAFASSGADRKSTRLNSSHMSISYAVFCLKKKKKKYTIIFYKKKNHKNQKN